MASAIAISPAVKPSVQLALVSSQPMKFDAAFLERRMREHRQWQQHTAEETTREVFREIAESIACQVGVGPAKIARLK